jgi:hypothetical protein
MPLYAIARTTKQKGGSVASSGHHNDRTRETLNADPERLGHNRILIGDDRNVRERVSEVIREHGGKPRSDSVEAVEIMLTATHEYFIDEHGEIDEKKLAKFLEQAKAFLRDPRSGGICVKAVLHLDERTPHVHGHKVPIDPNGKLNCKFYLGGREKMAAFQDLYHSYMAPLELERGERGSQARHVDIQKFYGAITQEHRLIIAPDKLPDPPLIPTREALKKYKREIIKSVNEQAREPLRTLQHQAMLTREEASKREAAESRADERIKVAEHTTATAMRQNDSLTHENLVLKKQVGQLEKDKGKLLKDLSTERITSDSLRMVGNSLYDRLHDIPVPDVMEKMSYGREQQGNDFIYRDAQQRVALVVNNKNELSDHGGVICRNSLDAVLHMMNEHKQQNISPTEAFHWLAENFGSSRAVAAVVVAQEQHSAEHLREWSLEKARAVIERDPLQKRTAPGREPTLGRDTLAERSPEIQMPERDMDFGLSR